MNRIAIAGAPGAGKTTLALRLGEELCCTVQHADDLIATHSWSHASQALAWSMLRRGPWVIEGVAVVRALAKALKLTHGKAPCDRLVWLPVARTPLNDGQRRMFAADDARMDELTGVLRRAGVEVVRGEIYERGSA